MKKSFFLLLAFAFLLLSSTIVYASPSVSFVSSSNNGKVTLTPVINSDVTHYKWEIERKGGGYNSETDWIASADLVDHISYLDGGHYFVTIRGKNTDTGEETKFVKSVISNMKEDYVEPVEKEPPVERMSLIINSLPEPFRSYLLERNSFELGLIVACFLGLVFVTSRRKKIKKYIVLERYRNE